MSAIDTLIAQISDPRLRERLTAEWNNAKKEKKFGLVFEDHLPELLPLHGAKPRKGDLVCRRQGALKDVWQIKSIHAGVATCVKPSNEAHPSEPTRAAAEPVGLPGDRRDLPAALVRRDQPAGVRSEPAGGRRGADVGHRRRGQLHRDVGGQQ